MNIQLEKVTYNYGNNSDKIVKSFEIINDINFKEVSMKLSVL